jgi:hypothetical protein
MPGQHFDGQQEARDVPRSIFQLIRLSCLRDAAFVEAALERSTTTAKNAERMPPPEVARILWF